MSDVGTRFRCRMKKEGRAAGQQANFFLPPLSPPACQKYFEPQETTSLEGWFEIVCGFSGTFSHADTSRGDDHRHRALDAHMTR